MAMIIEELENELENEPIVSFDKKKQALAFILAEHNIEDEEYGLQADDNRPIAFY